MSDNLPVRLYQFLSEQVGSEDVVLTRRLLYSIVDHVCSTKHVVRMTSGSKGEGLDMSGSDLDIMLVLNNINIYEFPQDDYPLDSFIMVTKSTKPGFTRLQVCGTINPFLRIWCVNFANQLYLSSHSLKSFLEIALNVCSPPTPYVAHGPCLSPDNYFEDLAVSFRCRSWIGLAHQWVTRNRFWPPSELVSKITDFGVMFVPIGCKGSPNEFLEWRISFSAAEKLLIHSFSHTQLLCYALLKLLLKEIVEKNENCKGLLCSYFLKTVVFWESESLPASEWRLDNIVSCFMNVFKRLLYHVEYNHLPHYFITDNDLFENRFSLEQQTALKNELNRLYQKDIFCMKESRTLVPFFCDVAKSSNCSMTRDIRNQIDKINILMRIQLDHAITIALTPKTALEKMLDLLSHNKLKSNRFLYLTTLYNIVHILGSKHIARRSSGNKDHYINGYKQYFPYLMCGRKTDAFCGWISIANYFYKMKRYQHVLDIVDHVLPEHAKCTHKNEISPRRESSYYIKLNDINDNLFNSFSNIADLYHRSVVHYPIFCFLYSIIIPELDQFRFYSDLPPTVYATFLKFLCFHHLSHFRRKGALKDLQATVRSLNFNRWNMATSTICLGISFLTIGDRQEANTCFTLAGMYGHHNKQYFQSRYCPILSKARRYDRRKGQKKTLKLNK